MLGTVSKRSLLNDRDVPDVSFAQLYGISEHDRPVFEGNYHVCKWYGLDVIDIACKTTEISPLESSKTHPIDDCLFLFKQIKGSSEIRHNEKLCLTEQGDYILLEPSTSLHLNHIEQFTHFVSIHLPKQKILNWTKSEIDIGTTIKSSDPKGMALSAAFPSQSIITDQREAEPDFLFDLVHIAFKSELSHCDQTNSSIVDQRLNKIAKLLENNLLNPAISLSWLAKKTDMSERQLQRFLKARGTSYSNLLTELRLKLFIEQLQNCERLSIKPNISRIAYKSGFSDISHFNRIFKKHFACSPTQYTAQFLS